MEAPKVTSNSIPGLTKVQYTTRSTTSKDAKSLAGRIRQCMEADALASGCRLVIEEKAGYADLRVNEPLSNSFQQNMAANGIQVLQFKGPVAAATDQGNVG